MMKIYRSYLSGYKQTAIIYPGNDHPEVKAWVQRVNLPQDVGGGIKYVAAGICVVFIEGESEVEDLLGKWMINNNEACAKRQPAQIRPAAPTDSWVA